jgi:hypothetical protein
VHGDGIGLGVILFVLELSGATPVSGRQTVEDSILNVHVLGKGPGWALCVSMRGFGVCSMEGIT